MAKGTRMSPSERKLRDQLEQSEKEKAMLSNMLSRQTMSAVPTVTSGLVVGIKNISNYRIAIKSPIRDEGEYHLDPEVKGRHNPNTYAVISYACWNAIRKGRFVEQGMILRDDSVLGPTTNPAPEDRPEDLARGFEVNAVLDPEEWIESREEDDLRAAVSAMTSEPSLRRLKYAVDCKVRELGAPYAGQKDRAVKAVRQLPFKYKIIDEIVDERLDELHPTRERMLEDESKPISSRWTGIY